MTLCVLTLILASLALTALAQCNVTDCASSACLLACTEHCGVNAVAKFGCNECICEPPTTGSADDVGSDDTGGGGSDAGIAVGAVFGILFVCFGLYCLRRYCACCFYGMGEREVIVIR
jgi:hypothetical protein